MCIIRLVVREFLELGLFNLAALAFYSLYIIVVKTKLNSINKSYNLTQCMFKGILIFNWKTRRKFN